MRRATRTACAAASSSSRSDGSRGSAGGARIAQRLRADLRQARDRLAALATVVRVTGRELDPSRMVEVAMDRIGRLTGVRRWILALVPAGHETLVVEQAAGSGLGGLRGATIAPGEGLLGRAARGRQAVVAPAAGEGAPDLPGRARARTCIAVPLVSRGRVIGVMALLDRAAIGTGGRTDARIAALLLEPLAVALDSAMLLRRSEELSVTDDLTKLYNSRYLNAALRREVERSRRYRAPVSVIFLDLDGFKSINDRHGHLFGSRALVEVGAVIRATVREIDIVARFGGDEFTVILPQTGREGARVIAERIRARVAATTYLKAHGLEVRITASFGIATYPEHGVTGEELVARADQAMYAAKGEGKDRVIVAGLPALSIRAS